MTRKEWEEVLTSESLKLESGKRTLSFDMQLISDKAFACPAVLFLRNGEKIADCSICGQCMDCIRKE